jgi:outer membrane protein OmpA-like peptidoglycan-associated protein
MIDFVIAMRKEFHSPFDLSSNNPAEEPFRRRIREKLEAGQSDEVNNPGSGRESSSKVPTDFSSQGGTITFEDDSDSLNERTREMAQRIGTQIKGSRFIIEVRGHASPSEAALNTEKAFALAHKRALAVAEQLVGQGVDWKQVRVTSCGANETKTSRPESYDRMLDSMNQRVEVIVTGEPIKASGDAQGLPKKDRGTSQDPGEGGSHSRD